MRRPFLLALLAMLACSRAAPSPEYSAAREKHAALVAAHPGDAAALPEMDEVLALLARVPPGSADAPAAGELAARIAAERQALRADEARRAALVEKAGEAPSWPTSTSIGAPPPKPAPITAGMRLADFQALHGACFERVGDVTIADGPGGKERAGESWAVRKADEECASRYAGQLANVVLIADGAVVGVRPAAEGKASKQEQTVRREERREVELVPMADGKWGMKRPDGTVEPVPPGAELRTRDGAPLPPPPAQGEKRP